MEFQRQAIDIDGIKLSYREVGTGEAIIDLGGPPAEPFHKLLAETCRVIVFDEPATGAAATPIYAKAIERLGLEQPALLARGDRCRCALDLGAQSSGALSCVILLSPQGVEEFPPIDVPILALRGTRAPRYPTPGQAGNSHLVLIYDAADTPEAERPEAVAAVVANFVAHRDQFIVNRGDSRIYP